MQYDCLIYSFVYTNLLTNLYNLKKKLKFVKHTKNGKKQMYRKDSINERKTIISQYIFKDS